MCLPTLLYSVSLSAAASMNSINTQSTSEESMRPRAEDASWSKEAGIRMEGMCDHQLRHGAWTCPSSSPVKLRIWRVTGVSGLHCQYSLR